MNVIMLTNCAVCGVAVAFVFDLPGEWPEPLCSECKAVAGGEEAGPC